ncbi:ureidoglycolate lyase [Paracoccus xiamenensis]|uniref:ureidoglycolate lyase n=1 Tax=Paracoccus xiamenensis TaxID=2714901 RepID=UPI0014092071|nr:ureidoglycolate lyase [Paracoccus xiamenensis]NHF74225.1 ureidoglycolate lyase [Paracoccus xiamenensis]
MNQPITIVAEPLTAEAFAPFGEVLQIAGAPDRIINQGKCGRYHDLAGMDFTPEAGGRAGISLFQAELRPMPYLLDLLERHPLGSQAFIPMSPSRFLVTVAEDDGGKPGHPRAFIAGPGQGVNLRRNVWHGVLCPLDGTGLYGVVDRIGEGDNLEEHWLEDPITVTG